MNIKEEQFKKVINELIVLKELYKDGYKDKKEYQDLEMIASINEVICILEDSKNSK